MQKYTGPNWERELRLDFERGAARQGPARMAAMFAEFRAQVDENPMLVFRTGAVGATEPECLEMLAADLGAKFVSGADIKRELLKSKSKYTRSVSVNARKMYTQLVSELLNDGYDVVGDMAFNSEGSREATPIAIANEVGALLVGINTFCDRSLIRSRINRLTERGEIDGVRLDAWKEDPLKIALDTDRKLDDGEHLSFASPEEPGIDYVFETFGARKGREINADLMGQFYDVRLTDELSHFGVA